MSSADKQQSLESLRIDCHVICQELTAALASGRAESASADTFARAEELCELTWLALERYPEQCGVRFDAAASDGSR